MWRITAVVLIILIGKSQAEIAYIQTKSHRNVCVSPFANLDICNKNDTVELFSGYEPEVRGFCRKHVRDYLLYVMNLFFFIYSGVQKCCCHAGACRFQRVEHRKLVLLLL
jgi:hypothetical protein